MAALTIKNVKKSFGSVDVLKQVSINVQDGEFLVLVGPSGCGKSTLLNLIAGLERLTDGDIFIGDRKVNNVSPKDRDIAMVFQSYALYPNMTVRKNISFGLENRRLSKTEIDTIVERVATMLQIKELLHRKPKQLSGGQRQRVAMGRALARNPKIFLFDEPLSNLDAKLRVEMRTEIKLLHHDMGTTIVYVTHDQIEAMTLAQRIAVMKDGIVQQLDTPRNIYDNPKNMFVAGFIGSPSMNFIPCKVGVRSRSIGLQVKTEEQREFFLPLDQYKNVLAEQLDREIILGIRPEHLSTDLPGRRKTSPVPTIECPVKVVEPTGPDTLVFVNLNATKVTCRVHPESAKLPGEEISLMVDLSRAILFDPQTEERISA